MSFAKWKALSKRCFAYKRWPESLDSRLALIGRQTHWTRLCIACESMAQKWCHTSPTICAIIFKVQSSVVSHRCLTASHRNNRSLSDSKYIFIVPFAYFYLSIECMIWCRDWTQTLTLFKTNFWFDVYSRVSHVWHNASPYPSLRHSDEQRVSPIVSCDATNNLSLSPYDGKIWIRGRLWPTIWRPDHLICNLMARYGETHYCLLPEHWAQGLYVRYESSDHIGCQRPTIARPQH